MSTNEITAFLGEYWKQYKTEFIIGCLLIFCFTYWVANMGCAYKLTNEIIVYGNCQELTDYEGNISIRVPEYNFSQLLTAPPEDIFSEVPECPKCPFCDEKIYEISDASTTTSSSSTTTTSLVVECNCPICAKVVGLDLQEIKNGRPPGYCVSSECQRGYFIHKRECIVAVGLKPTKFMEGPGVSVLDTPVLNKTQSVLFGLDDGVFTINRTTWDVVAVEGLWVVSKHKPVLNNTWENGSIIDL
jgi:hypothetical protein